ncbi:hypothetical protein EC991_003058 [Linnemannia zychae]|nr:hypothetical protein EC991_003058 [Linnemannia zychae]
MFTPNSEYQATFDKISKVHSHGMPLNLSIPRMAIIGDQSSGKSSVLEAITKLSFPRDKGMCTRFATLVNLQRNSTLPKDMLSAKIEGEDAFNKRFAVVEPGISFDGVIQEAVAILCKEVGISDKVLELTLSGPTQSPLTIVDLPAFIRTMDDNINNALPEAIRSINRRFIKDSRTIILAVVPANNDLISSTSLSEAGLVDPAGERTIPIVTKPDRIEDVLLADWIEVILNHHKTMKLGYLVMRNSAHKDKGSSWEESYEAEEKFFESDVWNAVPAERKGRVAIRQYLKRMLHEHISRELPILKKEIYAAIETFKLDLYAIGTPIVGINNARQKLNLASFKLKMQMVRFLDVNRGFEPLAALKHKAPSSSNQSAFGVELSLRKLYLEYHTAMWNECSHLSKSRIMHLAASSKENNLSAFVSLSTFRNIVNSHYLQDWKNVTEEHVLKIHEHLSKALSDLISQATDPVSRDVFIRVFERFSRAQSESIKSTIQDIFGDESTPFALSSHYSEVFFRERIKNHRTSYSPSNPSIDDSNKDSAESVLIFSTGSLPRFQLGTSESLQLAQEVCKPHSPQDSEQHQQQPRIVDKVIMQTIERYMIKRIGRYYDMVTETTNDELVCMIELQKRLRQDLETKIADLEVIWNDL